MKTNYNPIFETLIKSFSGVPNDVSKNPNGFIKQVLNDNDLIQCDECGCYTPIYVTVKGKNFCSETCKELFFLGMEDSKGADKLNDEQDTAVEDTFEDYLNESKEFEL